MVETMQKEIVLRKNYLSNNLLESIYFGGGTPSLLQKNELVSLLNTIHDHFKLSPNAEITLEANPDDINIQNLNVWKEVGINRLSIGLQSFKKEDLRWMNRAHTVEDAINCVGLAQQFGFSNISVDLIYGLPDLSLNDWAIHIQMVLDMGIQHVSAYCLTVEDKTALHHLVTTNKIKPANEDDQSDQFLLLTNMLKKSGFQHYEISNFGLKGYEAVHNSNYWKSEEYLGIGPSAHSFNRISRRWNCSNNTKYIKHFGEEANWFEEEVLTTKDRWNEMILTGLRTSYGVNLDRLMEIHPFKDEFVKKVKEFEINSWLVLDNKKVYLTDQGRLKADFIASELFLL